MTAVAAVDLGASSGRVTVGHISSDGIALFESHRFPTVRVDLPEGMQWDILGLYANVIDGLGKAARIKGPEIRSVAVDSWAVDYGLLDSRGGLIGNPYHYRDRRTEAWPEKVHRLLPDLYQVNGLQVLPFNTLYQLASEVPGGRLAKAESLLLIPDLINYWLTGACGAEVTNASTTGLLDVRSRKWSSEVLQALGIRPGLLPELIQPGVTVGVLRTEVVSTTGLSRHVHVTSVGSHDTASAVVGVPAKDKHFAFVCSGTWSLVGVELSEPVTSEASREANFTNEAGVDGTVRFLRNVMGFWLVQESLRTWQVAGMNPSLPDLLEEAAALPPGGPVIDVDDAAFSAPGDVPSRIATVCRATDQPVPASPAQTLRCILESMALAFARTVRKAVELSGQQVDVVHVVGGGASNRLLCQLTANACGLPVVAGPVEATSFGNILVQGRALGALCGDLFDLREITARSHQCTRFVPNLRTS